VVFRPSQISYRDLLVAFWEAHDPTQENRQGNDIGTQYRSGIYTTTAQQASTAEESRARYEVELSRHGRARIATEIKPASTFFFAEEYHQQYLHKNPNGYCGLGGCGVAFPREPHS
jgi:peptide-methionine (S)-S-oxide reductase